MKDRIFRREFLKSIKQTFLLLLSLCGMLNYGFNYPEYLFHFLLLQPRN